MKQPNGQEYVLTHFNNTKPFIDIRHTHASQIYVSKNVLVLIGSPGGVRVHFDKDKKILALQPSDINDPDCFPVIGKTFAKSGILRIGSVSLVSRIWETMDWDKNYHYQILPKYYETENIAAFNLENAKMLKIPSSSRFV